MKLIIRHVLPRLGAGGAVTLLPRVALMPWTPTAEPFTAELVETWWRVEK